MKEELKMNLGGNKGSEGFRLLLFDDRERDKGFRPSSAREERNPLWQFSIEKERQRNLTEKKRDGKWKRDAKFVVWERGMNARQMPMRE
jgi:hypothetical protein